MSRSDKTTNFIDHFHSVIIVTNQLDFRLVDFIETYDRIIAHLKLLQFTGCFESNTAFYTHLKQIQKLANQTLGQIFS